MGLDMYLYAEKYVSGYSNNETLAKIIKALDLSDIPKNNHAIIKVNVGYWRKANAIHNWFVKNVQNGVDDCGSYTVSREDIEGLRQKCKYVLDNREDANVLPPVGGFFFGSTEIDEWYFRDLEHTVRVCDYVLGEEFEGYDFSYRSSW